MPYIRKVRTACNLDAINQLPVLDMKSTRSASGTDARENIGALKALGQNRAEGDQ
jgi:hypothetical protein